MSLPTADTANSTSICDHKNRLAERANGFGNGCRQTNSRDIHRSTGGDPRFPCLHWRRFWSSLSLPLSSWVSRPGVWGKKRKMKTTECREEETRQEVSSPIGPGLDGLERKNQEGAGVPTPQELPAMQKCTATWDAYSPRAASILSFTKSLFSARFLPKPGVVPLPNQGQPQAEIHSGPPPTSVTSCQYR